MVRLVPPFSEVRKPSRHPLYELRKVGGSTSKYMILMPLIDLKFLIEACSKFRRNFKSAAPVEKN
jgi:hypothetical protein